MESQTGSAHPFTIKVEEQIIIASRDPTATSKALKKRRVLHIYDDPPSAIKLLK